MPARPFSPAEVLTLESHLLQHGRYRDRMLIIAGTQVGYRITELLTWTVGQVLGPDGDIVREVTVTRALLKGGHAGVVHWVPCPKLDCPLSGRFLSKRGLSPGALLLAIRNAAGLIFI